MDELHLEELSVRVTQEKMDDAFRAAMQKAIDAGEEKTPTVVSKKPGTRIQRAHSPPKQRVDTETRSAGVQGPAQSPG